MDFKKFLLSAVSVTFATVYFGCSDKVAGTTENDNALANEESSSSVEHISGSTEEIPSEILSSSSAAGSCSSTVKPKSSSSETPNSIDTSTTVPVYDFNDSLIFNPPVNGGGYNGGGGGISGVTCFDSAMVAKAIENTITVGKFIAGRIEKLKATGLSEEQAGSTARQELYTALGLDEFFRKQPDQRKYMSNLLNYIFGSTTQSEFYQYVEHAFTETGTLTKEHYCNFSEDAPPFSQPPATGPTTTAFPGHIVYDHTMYNLKNCKGTLIIPTHLEDIVNAKCYDIPACDSSIIDTVIKASYNNSPEALFTCRNVGWQIANAMETETFGVACDKEGKYIVYEKKNKFSFVCSLDSGWYLAETIDAETFDVPCDKHGKLHPSTSNPTKTYVCRKEHFCRDYGIYPKEPCFDEGWDFAGKTDLETSASECDTEGKTYTSPSDPNLYYVCHDEKWKEFYKTPCDTDNKRVKINNSSVWSGFTEYICYNKTWRPTYEWHTDYPAEYYFNPEINYGSFKDPRDNYVYRTIEFKARTWIAENMKYAGFSDSLLAKETRCLDDSCKNVGRFYSIGVADKVCPEGWSLPDSSDMLTLGAEPSDTQHNISQLGGTGSSYSAPDTYGLSFILSGRIVDTDQPYSPWQGYSALFWMKETNEDGGRLVVKVNYNNVVFDGYYTSLSAYFNAYPDMEPSAFTHETFLTVRCVKK